MVDKPAGTKPYEAFQKYESDGVTIWLGPFKRGKDAHSKQRRCYTVFGSMRWGAIAGRCTRCSVLTVDKDHLQFAGKRRIEIHHQSGARPMRLETATPNLTLLQKNFVPTKKDQVFLGSTCVMCDGTEDVPADFTIETSVRCAQREIAYFGYDAIRMAFTLLAGVRDVVSDGVTLREKTLKSKETALALAAKILSTDTIRPVVSDFQQEIRRLLLAMPGAEPEHLEIVTREVIRQFFPRLGLKPTK